MYNVVQVYKLIMKNGYSKKEVAEMLGITPRTIHFYTDEGIIIPEISNPKGRGTTRIYSRRNLIELLLARELAKNGLYLERVKNVMNEMKKQYDENFLNPDGEWPKKKNAALAKLIIYDAGGERPLIKAVWKRAVYLGVKDYSSAIVIKISHLFDVLKK